MDPINVDCTLLCISESMQKCPNFVSGIYHWILTSFQGIFLNIQFLKMAFLSFDFLKSLLPSHVFCSVSPTPLLHVLFCGCILWSDLLAFTSVVTDAFKAPFVRRRLFFVSNFHCSQCHDTSRKRLWNAKRWNHCWALFNVQYCVGHTSAN